MKIQRLSFVAGMFLLASACSGDDDAGNSFTPVADTTLYEGREDNSNGAGQWLFTGNTDRNGVRRALLRFDLSTLSPDTTVTAARLDLVFDKLRRTTAFDTSLHRVTAAWGEAGSDAPDEEGGGTEGQDGDATWTHAILPDTTWTTPGGDFTAQASATTGVGDTGPYSWSGPGMVEDINAWIANPDDNQGWIVIGDEGMERTASRFSSREGESQPVLTLTFAD